MRDTPHPIGYVEMQRAWVGELSFDDVAAIVQDVREQGAREYPRLEYAGARLECTADGAGVNHYTLYAGFVPRVQSSEPLNPRNLNNAEHADQIGDPGRDLAIGMKEQKF